MTQSRNETAKLWLESWDPRTPETLSGPENDQLISLIGHPGFGLLLAILGAERQGAYVTLSYLKLSDSDQLWQANVLQGKIQGIERVRETLLELIPHDDPTIEGAKR